MEVNKKTLQIMREEIQKELSQNILPFWAKYAPDQIHGGFIGQMSNDLVVDSHAPKGLILNARILWTFSACASWGNYLELAHRAYQYLMEKFWDSQYGGAYWLLDYLGNPIDSKKKIYGQAFLLYALVEYYKATQKPEVLEKAKEVFRLIEEKSYDRENTGYFETYERDWQLASDLRLSDKDMNEKKSMNTHLHVMEAFTNLYRVWKDPLVKNRLEQLVLNFTEHIIAPQKFHLILFFDEKWNPKSDVISYGHDIEASWLLCEAIEVLEEKALRDAIHRIAIRMAKEVLTRAQDQDGGLFYEADPEGIVDSDKHFWVQAEGVVGFLNAYQLSKEKVFLESAQKCWYFIQTHLVDHQYGDWIYRVSREGKPYWEVPKISEWKCPYHSSRMCIEAIRRLDELIGS